MLGHLASDGRLGTCRGACVACDERCVSFALQVRATIAGQAMDTAAQLAATREPFDGGAVLLPATLPELADELAALTAGRRFVRSMQARMPVA